MIIASSLFKLHAWQSFCTTPLHVHIHTILMYSNNNKSSAVAQMGDRGHNRHRPKTGGCCAPFAGSWDPVSHNVAWAKLYFRTKWSLHPSSRLATIDMGQKLGGYAPLEGAGTQSNTTSPGLRFT